MLGHFRKLICNPRFYPLGSSLYQLPQSHFGRGHRDIGIHQARLKWANVWIISLVVILYQYLRWSPTLVVFWVKEEGEWNTHTCITP